MRKVETVKAAVIGRANDFKQLFIVSLPMLPQLLPMRWSKGNAGAVNSGVAAH